MKLNAIAASAAILAAGLPALASAQSTAPVTIVASDAQPKVADAARFQQGFVRYSFVNLSNVPAREVDFALEGAGQRLATIRDTGTFTKGATIDRFVATDTLVRDEHLAVAEVKFADGTVWTNDEVAPRALRQAADVSFDR